MVVGVVIMAVVVVVVNGSYDGLDYFVLVVVMVAVVMTIVTL